MQTVRINAPLSASVDDHKTHDGQLVLTTRAVGGDGPRIMAAHWSFSDGTTAGGAQVTHAPGGQATVRIVDGAGDTATATIDLK